jgi:hypothetical protein
MSRVALLLIVFRVLTGPFSRSSKHATGVLLPRIASMLEDSPTHASAISKKSEDLLVSWLS